MTLPGFDTESTTRPEHLLLTATGQPTVPTPAGYTFSDSLKIGTLGYWQNTDITFVQTDKPIYKPGQLGMSIMVNIQSIMIHHHHHCFTFVQCECSVFLVSHFILWYGSLVRFGCPTTRHVTQGTMKDHGWY